MSDRGIPKSFRHMNGYGSHTFSFLDANNKRSWVKFHFKTAQGIENITDQEAEALVGKDRESNQRDLFDAIERGDFPKWYMKVRSEEHTSELQSRPHLVCRLLLEK